MRKSCFCYWVNYSILLLSAEVYRHFGVLMLLALQWDT